MTGFRTLSEFFDDVIEENLGRDYKHIFDPQESLSVKKEVYTDPRGTVASRLTYFDESGNVVKQKDFINGKPVSTIPASIVDELEEVPLEAVVSMSKIPDVLPEPLCKGDNYPRYNLSFSKTAGMKIRFDTTGVSADRIQLSYGGDYLHIHISAVMEPSNEEDEVYLVKAIDNPDREYKRSIYIDTSKYSIKDLSYSIENGLVTVVIPYNDKKENLMVFKPTKSTNTKQKQRLVESENK